MTDGERTDLFWRSSQSGGRATTRRKTNRTTAGSYGDMTWTDPLGIPLLSCFTFELKNGYAKQTSSIFNFIESVHADKGKLLIEKWIEKVRKEAEYARSISYALVICRGGKTLIIYPNRFHRLIVAEGGYSCSFDLAEDSGPEGSGVLFTRQGVFRVMPLQTFFVNVRPSQITRIARKYADAAKTAAFGA